jgi:ATP-dependent helicase YprA (DUF1998 family)
VTVAAAGTATAANAAFPSGAAARRLETLLGPKGPLAAHLPGFAHRPQQVALARAVEQALVEGRPCLAEAGTGVGKTLAYLVPLVRWLDKHGGRAIVPPTRWRSRRS